MMRRVINQGFTFLLRWRNSAVTAPRASQPTKSREALFLFLQSTVIFGDEVADLVRHPQELLPLFSIKGDRKASQPVYGQTALLAHLQRYLPARRLLQCFILGTKPLDLCLQFLFRCHEIH